jgi:hypothetical protein
MYFKKLQQSFPADSSQWFWCQQQIDGLNSILVSLYGTISIGYTVNSASDSDLKPHHIQKIGATNPSIDGALIPCFSARAAINAPYYR